MTVGGSRQGIVALVAGHIDGTLLGTEQKGVHEVVTRFSRRLLEDLGDRMGVCGHDALCHSLTEKSQLREGRQRRLEGVRRGLFVDAVGARDVSLGQHSRHTLVGRKHGLLDEGGGGCAPADLHADGLAAFGEFHLVLRGLEVDGAPLGTKLETLAGNLVEDAKHLSYVLVVAFTIEVVRPDSMLEQGIHLVVGKACARVDGRAHGLARDHFPLIIECHPHAHRETVLARTKRTGVCRELLRKHRDDAVHQIDRTATAPGLEVHGRVPAEIVGHIGDVDPELIAPTGQTLGRNRVVVVAGIGRVNRHAEGVPQITSPGVVCECLVHVDRDASCLLEHGVGESRRQPIGGDDLLHDQVELR